MVKHCTAIAEQHSGSLTSALDEDWRGTSGGARAGGMKQPNVKKAKAKEALSSKYALFLPNLILSLIT